MLSTLIPDEEKPVYYQLDNHLARERVKENVQARLFHFQTFKVSAYSVRKSKASFIRRFDNSGSVCLACDKSFKKLRREAKKAGKKERDVILNCYHCQLAISCVDETCRPMAEFFHETACPRAESEEIEIFSRATYKEKVYQKIVERNDAESEFGPEPRKFEHRCSQHPFQEAGDTNFYCYHCRKQVLHFASSFSCQLCAFGVFCSKECFFKGVVTNHSSSCVPRCFNPLCNRKGFKMFCCLESVYCSSRCFHIDLQHNLSQHGCSPQFQYMVFYHTPADMGELSRFFVEVLSQMFEFNPELFVEPTAVKLLEVHTRVAAIYYPFALRFLSDVFVPLLKEEDEKFLMTRRAQWKYAYPYLLWSYYRAFGHCGCPQDLIALYAFEDFFT